jgi:WD40 repeat protein
VEIFSISGIFKDSVRGVDWNQFSLLGSNLVAICSQDKQLIIISVFRTPSGELSYEKILEQGFESEVWRVRFNRTGSMLAASYIERDIYNKVAIFKTVDGKKWEKTEDLFVTSS